MRDEPTLPVMIALTLLALVVGCVAGKGGRGGDAAPSPLPELPKSDSAWFDQVGQRWWTLSDALVTWQDAEAACQADYSLPRVDELMLIRSRGICRVDEACPIVWGLGVNHKQALTYDLKLGEADVQLKDSVSAVTYCVESK